MLKLDTNSVAQATEILVKDKTLSLTNEFTTLGFSESAVKDALEVLIPPLTSSISALLGGETSALEVAKTTETKTKTTETKTKTTETKAKNSKTKNSKTKAETTTPVVETPTLAQTVEVNTVTPEPVATPTVEVAAPAPAQTVAPEPVATPVVEAPAPVAAPTVEPAGSRAEALFNLESANVNMDLEL